MANRLRKLPGGVAFARHSPLDKLPAADAASATRQLSQPVRRYKA